MVDIEGLSVVFKRGVRRTPFTALDAVTLHVRAGEWLALVGPNGAGKSTLLYCLLGLLRPTAGRALVKGRQLEPGSPDFREVSYLPEEPHYHDYLTVEEAVTYYSELSGAKPDRQRVAAALDRLDLAKARSTRVGSCSKGMKQKVGIAQCLLQEPRLLILDEPMRGLDPVTVTEFRDVLIEMNQRGVTIVMSSHILSEVERVASHAAVLADGRLVALRDLSAAPAGLEDWFMSTLKTETHAHG